jgi:predicted NACHT family NTPase
MKEKLRACDVLNWDYLVSISEPPEGRTKNIGKAIAGFAYDFTSTADEDIRDQMLVDLLRNGTDNISRGSAEEYVKALANALRSDAGLVREFAKQNGVRLLLVQPK